MHSLFAAMAISSGESTFWPNFILILGLIYAFALFVISAWYCMTMATKKQRNPIGWAAIGFLFPLFGIIMVSFITSGPSDQIGH
jgi:hypothetical protein